MVLRYYFDLMSQPSRAVYIFLKINKIAFEPKPVALRKGEHFTDAYKKINPFQLVPVLDDDGFVLTESVAMLRYLSRKFSVPEHWFPHKNLRHQARVDQYLNWHQTNTRIHAAMIFRHMLIIPRATGNPVDHKQADKFRAEFKKTVGYLETYFLKDQPYLAGQEISVADLLGICELMQLNAIFEEGLYESNPVVKAWAERVKQRLQPQFDEGHQITFRTRDAVKKMMEAGQFGSKL